MLHALAIARYRLVVTRHRAATSYSFYAATDSEAATTAFAIVAGAGPGNFNVVLTNDGRKVAEGMTALANRAADAAGA